MGTVGSQDRLSGDRAGTADLGGMATRAKKRIPCAATDWCGPKFMQPEGASVADQPNPPASAEKPVAPVETQRPAAAPAVPTQRAGEKPDPAEPVDAAG